MDNGANELRREESDDFTADTVRHMNNDSHSARPQDMEESVRQWELQIERLCIPESDLTGHTPPELLSERIQALTKVLDDPLVPNTFRDRVLFEIEVYKHFIPENSSRLELDAVMNRMNETYHTLDLSLADYTPSPSPPPTTTTRHLRHQKSMVSLADSVVSTTQMFPVQLPAPAPVSQVLSWMSLRDLAGQLFGGGGVAWGRPTVSMIAAGNLILGTSLGSVLFFDMARALVGQLTPPPHVHCGSVTCLVVTYTQKLLVAGYDSGHIILWDIPRKQFLKVIVPVTADEGDQKGVDGHMVGHRIVHLAFVGPKERFVSADEKGHAFYHVFNRLYILNSLHSTRIHGRPNERISPTTVFALEGLPHVSPMRYPGDELRLIALTTPYKLAIMAMKPFPQILFRIFWKALSPALPKQSCMSCLAWYPARKRRGSPIVTDPILATSVENHIAIFKVSWTEDAQSSEDSSLGLVVTQECHWTLDDDVAGLHWINQTMIACVTRNEEIIFCHVPSRTILERTSIRHHQVVSHDLFSCALQSLPISPCNTYRHSVSVFKGRLLCLGVKDVMIASPIPWNDRLKLLMESKRFNTALLMALSMYDETPTHVTVGLPSDPVERKRVLALFINDGILKQLLDAFGEDASQSEFTPENLELLEVTTRTLFSSCITIGRLDTLFGQVFERFAQANLTDTFMETLEPLVLDGSITDIESPLVMHALTRRLESTNQLSRLQSIILKLDVSTLDIDAILQVTGKHFLFSALIHVYNQAFHDYVTPIAEMIRLLSGRDDETMSAELLSTLFAYLSATLSGKSFPSGVPLPEDIASKVIRDSFGFLFSASDCTWQGQQVLDTDQHYPYLTFMVIRDPQSFITLIDGLLNDSNLRRGKASTNNSTIHPHQESELFIDEKFILTTLQHLVEQNTSSREMIQLKCFIARSFARLRGSMTLEHGTLEKLVQSLVALVDEDSRQERQNAVMDLIRAGAAFDESLRRYEEAAFWQVYELLARSQMRLNLIVKSFLKDPERKSEVFDAIAELLNDSSLSYEQQLELKKIVLNQVKELASVDGRKVAQLFLDFWPLEHFNVVSRLSSVPRLQLSYLKGVFGQEEVPEVLKRDAMNKSWVNLHDIYFRRLVELDPVSLRPALDRAYTYASGYPFTIVDILKLAKLHHVADAACWILEKTGDLKGALQLFKEEMQRTQDEGTLQSLTHTAILFCDQIKGRLDAKEYQEYWLAIFDAVNSSPQGRDLASQVMDAMTGHIPLPTILLHIVQVQQRASLGDYRDMIDSMLTVNSYEQELYLATNDLVLTEVYNDFDSLVRSRRRAFKPARGFCRGCRKVIHLQAMRYDDRESEIVVMACQHSYHLDCLKKVGMKCKDCNPFSEKAKGKSRAS